MLISSVKEAVIPFCPTNAAGFSLWASPLRYFLCDPFSGVKIYSFDYQFKWAFYHRLAEVNSKKETGQQFSVSSYYRKIRKEARSGQATLNALDLDLFYTF
jgi:hypothetical protein